MFTHERWITHPNLTQSGYVMIHIETFLRENVQSELVEKVAEVGDLCFQ